MRPTPTFNDLCNGRSTYSEIYPKLGKGRASLCFLADEQYLLFTQFCCWVPNANRIGFMETAISHVAFLSVPSKI